MLLSLPISPLPPASHRGWQQGMFKWRWGDSQTEVCTGLYRWEKQLGYSYFGPSYIVQYVKILLHRRGTIGKHGIIIAYSCKSSIKSRFCSQRFMSVAVCLNLKHLNPPPGTCTPRMKRYMSGGMCPMG